MIVLPVPKNGRAWQEIAEAAPALRKQWESPELWPRIRQSLEAEAEKAGRRRWWHSGSFRQLSLHWQGAAAALVLVLSGLGGWMMLRPSQPASVEEERRLLTEQALDEIERSEGAYLKSIDKLSQLAAPKVRDPESAILSSYREKLLLIDSAIGELAQSSGEESLQRPSQTRTPAHLPGEAAHPGGNTQG